MRAATTREETPTSRRGRLVTLGLLVACVAVLFVGSGAAVPADGQLQTNNTTIGAADTTPPEWGNATKDEATVINVTFYDNGTIDESSINRTDFALSAGNVSAVDEVEQFDNDNSSGVYVLLELEDRVNADNVTVSFADGGGIADIAGNERTNGSATASDMDTLVPNMERYDVQRVNASTAEITLETNERLDGITMYILGPTDDNLSRANFTERVDGTAVYTTNYTVPEEGRYTFVLDRATDRSGNFLRIEETRDFEYDDRHPDVVLSGVNSTTVGTPVNFSAADSSADGGITDYQWRIDGGTILTGESIDIAFAVPGSHEIVVEVTGANGNTTVVSRTIQVAPGNNSAVTLRQQNATHATATVNGTGYLQQVRATNGSVVAASNVSLERLSATFPSDSAVDMTLTASNATPSSFGSTGLGLFEIAHGNVSAEQVSLRFGVNRTALNRTGATPTDVTLYRNDSGWTPLDTSIVSRESARVVYQADSPGLSQFAVGVAGATTTTTNGTIASDNETDDGNTTTANTTTADGNTTTTADGNTTTDNSTTADGNTTTSNTTTADGNVTSADNETTASGNTTETNTTSANSTDTTASSEPAGYPDIVVTNVTVNETDPSVGDNVSINVTAENRGTQPGNYSVAVVLNNTTLATHEMEIQPGETRTEQFVQQVPEEGALEVDGQRVANVSSGGGLLSFVPGPLDSVLSVLPNPLALWPDGIVGTILGGLIGLVVAVYAVLKALAIYLGY